MSYEWLRRKVADLSSHVPRGYMTFDAQHEPVIQSDLPALEWFNWARGLLTSVGRDAEKATLRLQLSRSTGKDNGGGRLYEVVAAFAHGPVERGNDVSKTPAQSAGKLA